MRLNKTLLLRYAVQIISLLSFVLLLSQLSYPLGVENTLLQWFSRLDPWLLLSQFRWQQVVPVWFWLPLLTLAATLLWGRIFCGWLCPFGAFLALTDKIGRIIFRKPPARGKALRVVQPMRRYWLLLLVSLFLLGSNWVIFLTPFALFSHEIVQGLEGQIPWLLIGITAITLVFSRIWCSVLCPTGVLLSLVAKRSLFRYQAGGNCVHCQKCTKICPVGTAPASTGAASEGCLVCGDCQRTCPTKAVKWQRSFRQNKNSQAFSADDTVVQRQGSRRQFFKAAFAVTIAAALWKKTVYAAKKALRPPGTLPEMEFTAVCNRCGRCIAVCPSKALYSMPITDGLANFETPYIIPRKNRCDLCLACQEVCPTGAIAKVPLEKIQMGKAVIDKTRCIAWNEGKLCLICGEQCPVLAIEADGEHRPTVLPDKCVGCGSCENACPLDGEAAIKVLPK